MVQTELELDHAGAEVVAEGIEDAGDLTRAQKLAVDSSSLRADATWYLAIALERSGRRDAASATLTDLCKVTGPRQAQACAGVRALTNR